MTDVSEVEALEALEASDGWQLVIRRICEEIELKRDGLERYVVRDYKGSSSLEYHQGFLAACRMLLDLPETMADEFETKEK